MFTKRGKYRSRTFFSKLHIVRIHHIRVRDCKYPLTFHIRVYEIASTHSHFTYESTRLQVPTHISHTSLRDCKYPLTFHIRVYEIASTHSHFTYESTRLQVPTHFTYESASTHSHFTYESTRLQVPTHISHTSLRYCKYPLTFHIRVRDCKYPLTFQNVYQVIVTTLDLNHLAEKRLLKYSRTSNSGHFYRQGQVAVIGRWPLFRGLLQIWESVWD